MRFISIYTLVGLLPTLVIAAFLLLVKSSLWPAVLTYHILCFFIPLAFRCTLRDAGLICADKKTWLLTMLLSVLLFVGGILGSHSMGLNAMLPEGWDLLVTRLRPWRLFVIYSLLVNPFAEEFFWRGFLAPKTGIIQGAFLFWLLHVTAIMVFVEPLKAAWITIPVLAAGLLWGWMRRRSGALWPSFVTHLTADISILYAISQAMKIHQPL